MPVSINNTTLTFNDGTTMTTAATGGVTSLNGQTGAITNTDYGAIGSYTIAFDSSMTGGSGTVYDINRTIAGSNLARSAQAALTNVPLSLNTGMVINTTSITGLGLTGTWRQLSRVVNQTNFSCFSRAYGLSLWVRIS
jgi:hypothetical protein